MTTTIAVPPSLLGRVQSAWEQLTHAERIVFGIIVLLPVWWGIGYAYILLLLLLGIALSDWWRFGRIRLAKPRLEAVLLLCFGVYCWVNINLNAQAITGHTLLGPLAHWLSGGLLLWYIQSNHIRVRLRVALWAGAVLMAEILALWFVAQIVMGGNVPILRSLTGLLLGKQEQYAGGMGDSNYLRLLDSSESFNFFGGARYSSFFAHPEFAGQAMAFVCLLSLSGRGLWPFLLGGAGLLALLLTGTRSALLCLAIVAALRFVFSLGKSGGIAAVLALAAAGSFTILSVPPVTEAVLGSYQGTVQSTDNFRKESTDARRLIYERTFEKVAEDLPLFGFGMPGKTVIPGYKPAQIGSHSFILGSLLYCQGFVGTALFVAFWSSLWLRLWQERDERPDCGLWTLVLWTMISAVVAFEIVRLSVVLLCVLLVVDQKPSKTAVSSRMTRSMS
ncbi:O-antigen ligase family protein [Gloeobacter violaceus]|uniref:Gll1795 protein n=1 Tax=Gloeobacter violaceus (strain ATCC 29082 / PCC 7421) TaxID=251221 RepID=Q7NJN7_GLOVI|nr:O-antigen ligase family protein [Gloeobacter violaceus]BAC89736.1 gll1795 [Gloeobacter violaceus PCC 7421]